MLCDIIVVTFFLVVLFLTIVLVIVIVDKKHVDIKIVPQTTKTKEESKDTLDEDLREFFVSEYIHSEKCISVKLKSLPSAFKIGNVYFNLNETKTDSSRSFEVKEVSILSHVESNGKVFDNGFTQYYISTNHCLHVSENKDLMNYILNNLDRVEEIKDVL